MTMVGKSQIKSPCLKSLAQKDLNLQPKSQISSVNLKSL